MIVGGGVYVFVDERKRRRRFARDDARAAAARYRAHYGEDALLAIGDHILAASFAPSSDYRSFLKLVLTELLSEAAWPQTQSACAGFEPPTIRIPTPKRRGSSREE
jgi:hypothetical protein